MWSYWQGVYQAWVDFPLREGRWLGAGKYRVLRCLGMGSYGITYLCEGQEKGEHVVVKQAKPSKGKLGRELLEREGAILAALKHPRIPKLRDTFRAGKQSFLVMDYLAGVTVEELVFGEGKAFSERDSLNVILQLMDIVGHIHSQGIVHLDLRIPNVIWKGADVYLIDFGLARFLGDRSGLTGDMEEETVRRRTPELQSDYYAIGHFLLYLLYTSFPTPAVEQDRGWEEELVLSPATRQLLRRLLQADAPYADDQAFLAGLHLALQELE